VHGIWDALNPGGFLALGHSESLNRVTSMFRLRRFPEALVYQRPE
jgi:chemotaxis protein methyltransferase CheR